MRARVSRVVGGVLVAAWGVALLAAVVTTPHRDRRPISDDPVAASAFVEAWERARLATFVRSGTFERRRPATGAVIASEDVLAQRPPRRLHRQLGGTEGRDQDRLVSCAAPIEGQAPPPCRLGAATGVTYVDDVAAEVSALRSLVGGSDPVYEVAVAGDRCFDLRQVRAEPRVPFGVSARFCFDATTGAPTDSRVRYAGGVEEVIVVVDLRAEVTDADLDP